MARLIQSVEFFVVGGAVQSDRSCYIERSADQHLIDAVVGQRFAFVLAPRGSGKTSLMLRASALLRAESQHTAVVDIRQIAAHGEGSDPSRWFYGVARRICRELRLKFDLQTWWQERSALNAEQRFAEFFADIVLAQTEAPVTIFFDEVEHVRELAFASDFFEVIRNCYALRASEPEFARLNFVVLGTVPHTQLCPDAAISPFVIGDEIQLPDFSVEEVCRFEPGFDVGSEAALGLLERVWSWTNGQPYLTQKLARAVSRRGGRLEDVERCAQELFLSTNAASEEPQLSYVSSELTARGGALRTGLHILRRVARGQQVAFDAASRAQERLFATGVVRRGAEGALEMTNRVYARVFNERWVRSAMPFNWRGLGVVGGIVVLLALLPYWYVNNLPRPYTQTLVAVGSSFEDARSAYDRLHRLPGFAATADRLFADVLARRAAGMTQLVDIIENDAMVRSLGNGNVLADRLLGEFWLRRAGAAVHAEDRDAALLYTMAALDGRREAALEMLAELGADDYGRLLQTVRLAQSPGRWAASADHATVSLVDTANAARIAHLPDDGPVRVDTPVQLTALQHTAFVREQSVDSDGSAGEFSLRLTIDHPVPGDLMVTLAAPSGASVIVALDDTMREGAGFVLDARQLAALADERRQGVWRLTLVDSVADNAGVLHNWSLAFADVTDIWLGAPDAGVPIPEPVRTAEVELALSDDGRVAVAQSALTGASASLAVWDLAGGTLLHDLRLDRPAQFFELTPDGAWLIVMAGNELLIWSVREGRAVSRIATQTQFLLPPAISSEGGYVAISERVENDAPLFSLIRISDATLVASVTGRESTRDWILGPEARYLALTDESRTIDVIEPRRGARIATLELDRPVARVIPVDHGELMVTVDAAGLVQVWQFVAAEAGMTLGEQRVLGTTSQPGSVSVSADAETLAMVARPGDVVVHDLAQQRAPLVIRAGVFQAGVRTRLSADGTELLTAVDGVLRSWRIDERPVVTPPIRELTSLAIGSEGRLAALGFSGGFVRAASLNDPDTLSADTEAIDYIGHRGAVTAIAMNVDQNLVASGGRDGTARLWNLATMSPGETNISHAGGPVAALSLSPDARWLLVGGPDSADLWRLPDGESVLSYPANGAAAALAFSPRSQWLAIGDTTGNIIVARPGQTQTQLAARADSAIAALAFARSQDYVVSGDVLGNLRFWPLRAGVLAPASHQFREPIRWIGFAEEDDLLIVQTRQWLHAVRVGSPAQVEYTQLLPPGLEAGAAAIEGQRWRLLGGLLRGRVDVAEVQLGNVESEADDSSAAIATTTDALEPSSVSPTNRPWGLILGYEFDSDGIAVPVIH